MIVTFIIFFGLALIGDLVSIYTVLTSENSVARKIISVIFFFIIALCLVLGFIGSVNWQALK